MKSVNIVFTRPEGVALVEEEVAAPGEGEVLCRTEKSLVSIGTEVTCLKGVFDEGTNWKDWVRYPFHPGYSVSATVLEVGPGVRKLRPGDRVSSGMTHNQFFTAPEDSLLPIPEGVGLVDATWISLLRVAQNVVRKCQVQMGDRVAIIGQGQVGQLVTQFVRVCGSLEIIAIDPAKQRIALSRRSGATQCVTCSAQDAYEPLRELTAGKMADIVIDSTGHPSVFAQACRLARRYGKIGLVGDTAQPSRQMLGPGVVSNSLTILGAHGSMTAPADNDFYPWTERFTNEISMRHLEQGRISTAHLISHTFSPLQAEEVYAGLLRDRSSYLGVVFDWTRLEQ